MTTAANRFLHKAGAKIAESLGGDGVQELLAAPVAAAPATAGSMVGRGRNREAGTIDIGMVVPDPEQPRKQFDEGAIGRLAESLKKRGQMQNLRVRWSQPLAKWVIISGERRYRAAVVAGLTTLKCEFVERELTDAERLEDALVENCLREDLNTLELAKSYQRLMTLRGYTAQQLAAALDVSGGAVSKTLAVLKLPDDLQAKVADGTLARSTAYELSRAGGEDEQRAMADRVAAEGLNTAQVADTVQGHKGRRNHAATKTGRRLSCTLPGGDNLTFTGKGEWTLDGLLAARAAVTKAAKKAKVQGVAVADLPGLLRGKGAKAAEPTRG